MDFFTANLLYIDPAGVSILLTSLSGIVIALSVTGIILWRKFRKGVNKILKIDENKNKEVEDEVVVTDDASVENNDTSVENKDALTEKSAEEKVSEEKALEEKIDEKNVSEEHTSDKKVTDTEKSDK